jgi:hypothetical protein
MDVCPQLLNMFETMFVLAWKSSGPGSQRTRKPGIKRGNMETIQTVTTTKVQEALWKHTLLLKTGLLGWRTDRNEEENHVLIIEPETVFEVFKI